MPKRLNATRKFAILLVAGLQCGSAIAQSGSSSASSGPDAAALQPLVDRIVGGLVGREAIPGMIVGVSWRGQRSFFGYSAAGDRPYRPDTIVEIGSITKVFTTALFAEALIESKMRADASLQSLLPNLRLRPCAAEVTPLQLADFTSGMPALPGDVPRQLADRGISSYTERDFLSWVTRWGPGGEDGVCNLPAPYRYSNASVGLLGLIVAERLGLSWQDLIRERITEPLHMTSTAIDPRDTGRLAQGFGAEGQPVIRWPMFAWYAAGALRSTADDMLSFGEAALDHETTAPGERIPPLLRQALQRAMQPTYQPEGQVFGQGMAWQENLGDPDAGQRPVYLKVGGTDGFNSVLVINPGKDLAIFIAGSRPKSGVPRAGVELSRQIRRQ